MKEIVKHWNEHKDTFNMYIDSHQQLQSSMDILQPFIKPFESATQTTVGSCANCIIDMLIWVRSEVKKDTKNK